LKISSSHVYVSLSTLYLLTAHWDSDESIKRFILSSESELYQKLCNPNDSGECQFATTVTLDENLLCYERECRVDEVIIVQVKPGAFYEYIRQSCVQLSFYDDAKKVVTGYSKHVPGVGRRHTHAMCAHPRKVAAGRSCCDVAETDTSEYNYKMVSQADGCADNYLLIICFNTLSSTFAGVSR